MTTPEDGVQSPLGPENNGSLLMLNNNEVHPSSQIPGGDLYREDASHTNYVLIQFKDYMTSEQQEQLLTTGAKFVEKIPEHTWLVRYEPSDLTPIRQLPFVLYANPYHKSLKVHGMLQDKLKNTITTLATPGTTHVRAQGLSAAVSDQQLHPVMISLHPGTTSVTIIDQMVARFHIPRERLVKDGGGTIIRARLSASEIHQASGLDDVSSVEEEDEDFPFNYLSRFITGIEAAASAATIHQGVLPGNPTLDGTGQIVVVADSGFNVGLNSNPGNDAHPFFLGRVLALEERAATRNNVADAYGHGTHCAGTVLGRHTSIRDAPILNVPQDHDNILCNKNVSGGAPNANLILQAIMSDPIFEADTQTWKGGKVDFPLVADAIEKLFTDPYEGKDVNGAPIPGIPTPDDRPRIHSDSWGTPTMGLQQKDYNSAARLIDKIVKERPDYLIVRAAGNEGDRPDNVQDAQVQTYAVAKNGLTVGACHSGQMLNSANNAPFYTRFEINGARISESYVPRFSNRGPPKPLVTSNGVATPGIIKPDIVAPGVAIFSANTRDPNRRTTVNAGGLSPDLNCEFRTGTSMSCPMVSGAAAILRQALILKGLQRDQITAALMKALIINGATDLSINGRNGQLCPGNPKQLWVPIPGAPPKVPPRVYHPASGSRDVGAAAVGTALGRAPDDVQGFGRLNILDTIEHLFEPGKSGVKMNKVRVGAPWTFVVKLQHVTAVGAPAIANVKATMAYDDYPGANLSNELALSLSFSTIAAAAHDIAIDKASGDARIARMARNNVQKLEVFGIDASAAQIDVTITVTAVTLVPDPNTGTTDPQKFAVAFKSWYT